MLSNPELLQKYDVPVPRYTSYPTVPYWNESAFSLQGWESRLKEIELGNKRGVSLALYIHLPFCENLCTFCGCNKRITKNHEVELPYLQAVLKEWAMYRQLLPGEVVLEELHLGGGTPTFFAADHLKAFLEEIFSTVSLHPEAQMSLEGHPNHTHAEHLEALATLGFKRISFGVQDYDPKVQQAIHRIQSYEQVAKVTQEARALGFEFISHDLVFGLPFQTAEAIRDSIQKTIALKPDRISFYSYAHVPWVKGTGQRGFSEENLPRGAKKRALYELGKRMLEEAGYHEIGFDHFALEGDELFKARKEGTLHRNFMGYTTSRSSNLIGLGVSAISDIGSAYAQNEKTIEGYYKTLDSSHLPVFRGHLMTEQDMLLKKHILDLMCRFETSVPSHVLTEEVKSRLDALAQDGLLQWEGNTLKVSEQGIPFIRNICLAFDERFWANRPEMVLFSAGV
jgi:oxygen-independent coproporphyrinogen-3 oxidase